MQIFYFYKGPLASIAKFYPCLFIFLNSFLFSAFSISITVIAVP